MPSALYLLTYAWKLSENCCISGAVFLKVDKKMNGMRLLFSVHDYVVKLILHKKQILKKPLYF